MLKDLEIQRLKEILFEAGSLVMEIYAEDFSVEYKEDHSPLTQADLAANDFLCTKLQELYPHIPIISEESAQIPYIQRKEWEYYWCIDPIDGTKEFVDKNGEFTINVALMQKSAPIFSLVYAPVFGDLYYAIKGVGAYKQNKEQKQPQKLSSKKEQNKECIALISRSRHTAITQEFIDALLGCREDVSNQAVGSSLKFCMMAEGEGDIYPKFALTMEWDTAAAHLILQESGGEIFVHDESLSPCEYFGEKTKGLTPLQYNKEDLSNPNFIAVSVRA
ncbi:MAG: 3'(2'),5'-bisphosphate nucleotidase CysQ [Helicobacteraceae bacterium]|nr:3'(2'),5'-bisphosphate nucleotidase CysQ [Helicobacteraceae bacterium]